MKLIETLGNEKWLRENEAKLKEMLPTTWTHMENLNGLQLGFRLKLLGVEWHSEQDFGRIMLFIEKVGMMQRQNGYQVRANPSSIFR